MKKAKLYLAILLLTGCYNNRSDINRNDHQTLNIEPRQTNSLLLSSFVDSMAFVPLETKNNELINNITKVQYYNNNFYILDRANKSIFVFNSIGSFLKKLQRRGKGPGEYMQLEDFEVNNNGIFLLDYPNKIFLILNYSF